MDVLSRAAQQPASERACAPARAALSRWLCACRFAARSTPADADGMAPQDVPRKVKRRCFCRPAAARHPTGLDPLALAVFGAIIPLFLAGALDEGADEANTIDACRPVSVKSQASSVGGTCTELPAPRPFLGCWNSVEINYRHTQMLARYAPQIYRIGH